MPKSLGQIHSVNLKALVNDDSEGNRYLFDCSKELTQQLGHMVRSGNAFKMVGCDIGIDPTVLPALQGAGSVSGVLRYFAPTKGRVQAWNAGFKAVKNAMKIQGISNRGNSQYDFRVPLQSRTLYENGDAFVNCASQKGDEFSDIVLKTAITPFPYDEISLFGIHNEQLLPQQTAIPAFSTGLSMMFNEGATGDASDYVSNEGILWNGIKNEASLEFEEIPFQLAYDGGETTLTWQFRPDPALYISVMLGQFEVEMEEVNGESPIYLNFNFMFSGWKSLTGGTRRGRKTRSKSRRRKSRK